MEDSQKYLNELVDRKKVQQILLYTDDSVEVKFKDDSLLQLSPCGANYRYTRSCTGTPLLSESSNIIQQRCCFATSETKAKVRFAIKWRNHFSARPYLPVQGSLFDGDVIHLHKDITSFQWPNPTATSDSTLAGISIQGDGSVVICSNYDLAQLTLNSNRHHVQVDFLAKLVHSRRGNKSPRDTKTNPADDGNSEDCRQVVYEMHERREYVWMRHIFPSGCCPSYWKYPLALALQRLDEDQHDTCSDLLDESHAPKPFTSICRRQFCHKWHTDIESGDDDMALPTIEHKNKLLKILWNDGITYWITKFERKDDNKDDFLCLLEVWLSNGSVLKSVNSPNCYFSHLKFQTSSNKKLLSQRMYSTAALPLDPQLKTVVLRSVRLRCYSEQQASLAPICLQNPRYCWQDSEILKEIISAQELESGNQSNQLNSNLSDHHELFETVMIPKLGKFSAVGGSVQIIFEDGTTLHAAVSNKQFQSLALSSDELLNVCFRILSPDGKYITCNSALCPDQNSMHVKSASDWIMWLAKPKCERNEKAFYSNTIYASEKHDMIAHELEKIKRFNVLVENNSVLKTSLSTDDKGSRNSSIEPVYMELSSESYDEIEGSKMNMKYLATVDYKPPSSTNTDVSNALQNTTQAIDDIDNIIKALRIKR